MGLPCGEGLPEGGGRGCHKEEGGVALRLGHEGHNLGCTPGFGDGGVPWIKGLP